VSYTLRGRIETRLAAVLAPLLAAGALALALHVWWPLELAALMVGVGAALDLTLYHRLLAYQAGWLALPLGLLELGLVMSLALPLNVDAPLPAALAFYSGSWLLGQVLVHAALPLVRLSYAEDGGELGRAGPPAAAVVLSVLAAAGGVAWATMPPTVHLASGVHRGPLVLDSAQTLVGDSGAVVRGGILITADDVTVRDVTVIGGEIGIEIDDADRVRLERVRVSGARVDGINARQSSVAIRDCIVQSDGAYAQGIDISFAMEPSSVDGCTVVGGAEGIVSHMAAVQVEDNTVTGTTLRSITVTEMSMGSVERNTVSDALGIGIFCGDYSHCEIEGNSVSGVAPDRSSGDGTRLGFGIVAHYGAVATVDDNRLSAAGGDMRSFSHARISSE
jgi:nitrous oxidase accessory protein NosD